MMPLKLTSDVSFLPHSMEVTRSLEPIFGQYLRVTIGALNFSLKFYLNSEIAFNKSEEHFQVVGRTN